MYPQLELEPLLFVGTAGGQLSWGHREGRKMIDVGPLNTPLSEHADIHLRLRPGTSGALALGMAHVIIEEGLFDREFVENWTLGFDEYRTYCATFSPEATERITGVPADKIIKAARLYATTKPAAMVNSASVTVHHTNGVQNHRAITALIGLTGNFDRKGETTWSPPPITTAPPGSRPGSTNSSSPGRGRRWRPASARTAIPSGAGSIDEAQATELPFQIQSGKPYPIRAVVGFGLNHRMWPASDFMRRAWRSSIFSSMWTSS